LSAPGTRLLIVNADDFGLTSGVCRGILDGHRDGIITSTSALAVAPAFAEWAPTLRDSGLGVGGHLCCVGEDPPLLSATEVPTLVDDRGNFPLTWKQFLGGAARGRVDSDDLRREFGAQVESMQSAGLVLTHLDSHQNLHLWPQVASVMFELASRHSVRAIRVTRSSARTPTAIGVRALSARLERSARRVGLTFPVASTGLDEAGTLGADEMASAIDRLAGSGAPSMELATHPGIDADPDRARYEWGYRWAEELAGVMSPVIRRQVDRHGLTLGSFADLPAAA
jgi:predicted glycoside hydrolase/deacetylase ChbG (UPF0249 family)